MDTISQVKHPEETVITETPTGRVVDSACRNANGKLPEGFGLLEGKRRTSAEFFSVLVHKANLLKSEE